MKKILALLMCLVMVFALFACTDTPEQPTDGATDSAVSSSSSGSQAPATDSESTDGSEDVPQPEVEKVPNLVLAIDQIKERAVVYDLDKYETGDTLEDLEVWDVETGHAAGLKYREDTVFGDVVLIGGSKSAIYEYPSKKEIWSTTNPGNNTHSIEILPSGNIVLANSTGNSLRFFYTSALLEGDAAKAQKHTDYELAGAHGVLWDPEYEVLWALGGYELVAYTLSGEGTKEKLTPLSGMGCSLKGLGYGHDLQPDFTDSRYLYFTAGNVFRFDKDEVTASRMDKAFQLNEIKGFSNNPNNQFFSTGELGGKGKFFANSSKESWLTDTILFYTKEERRGKMVVIKEEIVAEKSAFYKVRSFYGKYQ